MTRTLAQALDAAAIKARHRKYHWCRLLNDFPYRPLWRAVSRRTKVPVHQVVVVALCLECLANESEPRGSIASLSVAELAAALDLRPDVVARVRAALEEPDVAWIDQEYIVDFHTRNPDREDPTAADRQRKFRAKRKAERERLFGAPPTGPPVVHSNVTSRRDSVTVTPRADQTFQMGTSEPHSLASRAESVQAVADRKIGESGENPLRNEQWLELEGTRIVIERMQCQRAIASIKVNRWLAELEQDATALRTILESADKADYMGSRFHNLVVDALKRVKLEARGPQLRFPPAIARRERGDGTDG